LAQLLLDKEVIFKENVEEIFGKRPWVKEEIEEAKVVTEESATPADETATKEAPSETEETAASDEETTPSAE